MATNVPTYADLIEDYPHFATTVVNEQTTINTILEVVSEDIVNDNGFRSSEKVRRARLLLGGHIVRLMVHRQQKHGGDGVGAINGRTHQGGVMVTYNKISGFLGEDILTSTPEGALYALMRRGNNRKLPRVSGMRRRR